MKIHERSSINNVALFGVPRSGTTWLGQIFNSSPSVAFRYQPLFSYEFKDRLSDRSTKHDIDEFNNDLLDAKSNFVLQKETLSGQPNIGFHKEEITTLVWKEVRYLKLIDNIVRKSDTKVILLTRHPGAVLNSWLSIPKEFDASWNPLNEWRLALKKNDGKDENFFGYEKWKEAVALFIKLEREFPKQVMIVKYEDLNNDSIAVTERLFDFVGLNIEQQTKDFIAASKSSSDNDPYGVFRQKQDINQWKDKLDERIINELIRDLERFEPAKILGYK